MVMCYCMTMTNLKHDHSGQRFGKLTALEHLGSGVWRCRCDCGAEKDLTGSRLRTGNDTSCGCSQPTKTKGLGHPRWKTGPISYSTAHRRVSSHRGPARDHQCSNGCGRPADSWAYRGGSPLEQVEERPTNHIKKVVRFSPDPADYDPMCWSCHARKDAAEAASRA